MGEKVLTMVLLLACLIACSAPSAFAWENESHGATLRYPVFWVSQPRSDTSNSCPQCRQTRTLVYQLERKGHEGEKSKIRTLWHI